MSKTPQRTDTHDVSEPASGPREPGADGPTAGRGASGIADDAASGEASAEDRIPGILELAHLLESRIEELCCELEEKSGQMEALRRSLAERDDRIHALQRELDESRGLIARLTEASQREAVAEADTVDAAASEEAEAAGAAVAAADTDVPPGIPASEDADGPGALPAAGDSDTRARPESAKAEDAEEASIPAPAAGAADPVAVAMKRQEAEHGEDQAELDDHLSRLAHWAARVETLREELARAVTDSAAELKECAGAFESLPPELQETLRGRHEGLELIRKMIRRLPDRLPELEEPPEPSLPLLSEDDWVAELAGENSAESAERTIRERLEEMSSKRYRTLSRARQIVETARQNVQQFLKAQVLPILDGIEDGERHSRELIARLKTTDPKSGESLDAWYRAYATLRARLLEVLARIEVRPLEVRCGAPIDYERQEPFAVETDPELNTEDVKEVTRAGYELTMDESGETFVLRPAQVIVVKNTKESDRG